jgi:site-specific recombinase XerD
MEMSCEDPIFRNCRGAPLTRFGARYILGECFRRAQSSTSTLATTRPHPHSIRHSTAVALLKSGVDLSTIAQWLGHASPNTTSRYATVDLEMKRKAISQVKPLPAPKGRSDPWRHNPTILEWLESL